MKKINKLYIKICKNKITRSPLDISVWFEYNPTAFVYSLYYRTYEISFENISLDIWWSSNRTHSKYLLRDILRNCFALNISYF